MKEIKAFSQKGMESASIIAGHAFLKLQDLSGPFTAVPDFGDYIPIEFRLVTDKKYTAFVFDKRLF